MHMHGRLWNEAKLTWHAPSPCLPRAKASPAPASLQCAFSGAHLTNGLKNECPRCIPCSCISLHQHTSVSLSCMHVVHAFPAVETAIS